MSAHQGPRDGIAQLTELMRFEPSPATPAGPPPVDPVPRRRRRRRGAITAGIVGLVIVALLGGYSAYALTAPLGTATLDAAAPQVATPPAVQIALPSNGAVALSVSGADAYLGPEASGVWMSTGDGAPQPIASISKLVSALVVLDAKPLAGVEDLGPTLTFSRADNALYDKYYLLGATITAMPTGSRMSERDALEMMLVVSASNYAEAVTNWAFGSQSAFLRATRDWLAANGLTTTTIVEPTGIDPRNTSTTTDLIALAKIAMAHPVVAQIVGMRALDVPGIPSALNTNDLIGVDGISGIKTGTLEDYGANLLFSATMDVGVGAPLSIFGVRLGGSSREGVGNEVRQMLAALRDGFHRVTLGEEGDQIGQYSTAWGESARILLGEGASILTWSDTPATATFTANEVTTGTDGDVVGSVTWTVGTETLTAPLVLDGTIAPPDAWWRLTHPFELGASASE